MDTHDSFPFLKEIILFLALSGVLMPLLSRLKITSLEWLRGRRELMIVHGDQEYRLRITQNDKLILTK